MSSKQTPAMAAFVESLRSRSGRAPWRTIGLLIVVSLLSFGCRTPWSVEPLPVERLETGMPPEAVRTLLGEPARVDAPRGPTFPTTWPGLSAGSEIHPTQAWHYEDEKVDRIGLGVSGVAFPITLPIHLFAVAVRADAADRDCMWVEEREIALYFEDERLAEWVVKTRPERGWCANGGTWQGTPTWPSTGGTTWGAGGSTPRPGPVSPPGRPGGC
jgi:hypothetical protein